MQACKQNHQPAVMHPCGALLLRRPLAAQWFAISVAGIGVLQASCQIRMGLLHFGIRFLICHMGRLIAFVRKLGLVFRVTRLLLLSGVHLDLDGAR